MDLSLTVLAPDEGVELPTRIAVAKSILDHRAATVETCALAIRALLGYDVVAEAGVL